MLHLFKQYALIILGIFLTTSLSFNIYFYKNLKAIKTSYNNLETRHTTTIFALQNTEILVRYYKNMPSTLSKEDMIKYHQFGDTLIHSQLGIYNRPNL